MKFVHSAIGWLAGLALPVALAVGPQPSEAQEVEIVWAGAGVTSTSYNHAAAYAAIITKYSDMVEVTAVPAAGSVEVPRLLNLGQIDVGINNTQASYDAYNAVGSYDGAEAITSLRLLWHMVAGVTHVVVNADSDIETVADLRGKRIAHVRPGSSAYVQASDLLASFDIDMAEDVTGHGYSHSEQVQAFRDGNVDAVITGGSAGSGQIQELITGREVRFLGITDEQWERLAANVPDGYYSRFVIPAGTYAGQEEDVHTFAIPSFWATTSNLSESVAYELARAFFENRDEAIEMVATIAETDLEKQTLAAPIPWHPGSKRYFEEQGVFD